MRDLVGEEGAAAAASLGPAGHAGLEEEAVDDQLAAPREQVEQARRAVRALEAVAMARPLELPAPGALELAWFVREAWPSRTTGTALTAGVLAPPSELAVTCELGEGGVVFGDGIEADRLALQWGQRVTVGVAPEALALVR